jgi:hypothetical protein
VTSPPPAGKNPAHLPPGLPPPVRQLNMAEWDEWWDANLAYWHEVVRRLETLVPCQGVEDIASGLVVTCVYEDKSYSWLGSNEEEDGDGPWIGGTPNWVGGFRYEAASCGERFTELLMLRVPDPEDINSVVETLAEAARRLGALPITQSV